MSLFGDTNRFHPIWEQIFKILLIIHLIYHTFYTQNVINGCHLYSQIEALITFHVSILKFEQPCIFKFNVPSSQNRRISINAKSTLLKIFDLAFKKP